MPIVIILTHLLLVCGGITLLMLLCSTGNFWNYPASGAWIAIDLLISITGIVYVAHPEYAHIALRLAKLYTPLMLACLAWMGWDNHREAHVLSGPFFWGFAAFALVRLFETWAWQRKLFTAGPLEAMNAIAYLLVVGSLISMLLLRLPPDPVAFPNPIMAAPRPPVAALTAAVVGE